MSHSNATPGPTANGLKWIAFVILTALISAMLCVGIASAGGYTGQPVLGLDPLARQQNSDEVKRTIEEAYRKAGKQADAKSVAQLERMADVKRRIKEASGKTEPTITIHTAQPKGMSNDRLSAVASQMSYCNNPRAEFYLSHVGQVPTARVNSMGELVYLRNTSHCFKG